MSTNPVCRGLVEIQGIETSVPIKWIGDCHVWDGYVNQRGYPVRMVNQKRVCVHREVYQLVHGPLPFTLAVHHTCENKRCVNVEHMLAVTKADHVRIHRAGKPLIGGRGHSAATSRTPVGANALPDSGGSR
jgi:hypothetical protein